MAEGNSTKKIWIVFWILFVLTTIEVILGIFKPEFLTNNSIIGVSLLNHTFIFLTLLKAYYIVMTFMHLGDEKKSLKLSIITPMFVLIPYLLFILLVEASFHGAIG
ncbi:MAG: cytochrome C oxidase subunit IV [Flavobacteriales bacterium]|nr:cytochrome C oxidase subunit IV [Flavobacteriales bacterium]|tara:strand:+ start:155 stop:472 length:318 start_codon:yes stop_codon:yes gene_type:complete